jgi:hypothetical protein
LNGKIDEIVKQAYLDLDKFYKVYGGDSEKKPQEKSKLSSKSQPSRVKIITPTPKEPEMDAIAEIIISVPKEPEMVDHVACCEVTDSLGNQEPIIFDGMASREIIARVQELTGEKITICVKSKKNVLRHAGIILAKHGYVMKG